jgi:hypothetical protein
MRKVISSSDILGWGCATVSVRLEWDNEELPTRPMGASLEALIAREQDIADARAALDATVVALGGEAA